MKVSYRRSYVHLSRGHGFRMWMRVSQKFSESPPFSYTCHNFDVADHIKWLLERCYRECIKRGLFDLFSYLHAWSEESAPFSYTCDKFHVSDCVKFEESSPFPYTCHKFHVSECVEFEESAAFCSKSVSALWTRCELSVNALWLLCEWSVSPLWMICECSVNGLWRVCDRSIVRFRGSDSLSVNRAWRVVCDELLGIRTIGTWASKKSWRSCMLFENIQSVSYQRINKSNFFFSKIRQFPAIWSWRAGVW